jgi:phospholipid:diacylglycerol acyltransferase
MLRGMHGRKVVVLVHSMGSTVWHYFCQWLSSPEGGALSSAWLHDHVESVVLIGPSTLGAPKAVTGLLMGESRDFTYLTGTLGALVDAVLSPRLRRRLMRSFPSTQTLLPMGGDAVWGDADGAPDDPEAPADAGAAGAAGAPSTHGALLQFQATASGAGAVRFEPVMTVAQGLRELEARAARSQSAPSTQPFAFRYSHGLSAPEELLRPSEPRWLNPLATALPYAPHLTYHCMYGVGIPTERSYVVVAPDAAARAAKAAEPGVDEGEVEAELVGERAPDDEDVPYVIDRSASAGRALVKGVRLTDGDGTIPLVSLGYMCARGWRDNRLFNPSGSRVVTREFAHEPQGSGGRGELSADHVDILGNRAVITDVLQIVAGKGAELSDRFESDIRRISDRVARRIARAHGFGAADVARAAETATRAPDGHTAHADDAAHSGDDGAAELARRTGDHSAAFDQTVGDARPRSPSNPLSTQAAASQVTCGRWHPAQSSSSSTAARDSVSQADGSVDEQMQSCRWLESHEA